MTKEEFRKDVFAHAEIDVKDKYVREVIKDRLRRLNDTRWKLIKDKFTLKLGCGTIVLYEEMFRYIKNMKSLKVKEDKEIDDINNWY